MIIIKNKRETSLKNPCVTPENVTLGPNKNLLEKCKAEVLRIDPKAKVKSINKTPRVFSNKKDLSTMHFMPIPKTEEQAWLQASKSVDFQKSISLPVASIFSAIHYNNVNEYSLIELQANGINNHC